MTRGFYAARIWPVAAIGALALAGCSSQSPVENNSASVETVPMAIESPTPAPAETPATVIENSVAPETGEANASAGATIGGDGSEIVLNPLTQEEARKANLSGELACGFFAKGQSTPLLLAKGNVGSSERSQGVVKVAGYVEPVSAAGGFDGMTKGARFAGKGKTLTVRVTGAAVKGVESPSYPATMTYDRADGGQRSFDGLWVCGP